MRPAPDRKTGRQRGQSLVEFTFSLMMLLILLVGIVDSGRALFTYLALRDAAQEGALYGSTDPTNNAEIEARVRNNSDMLISISSDVTVNIGITGSACMGNGISVTVTYAEFPLTMPFIGAIVGAGSDYTVPISASVTDTILRPPC